jgi:hypothetical protein
MFVGLFKRPQKFSRISFALFRRTHLKALGIERFLL